MAPNNKRVLNRVQRLVEIFSATHGDMEIGDLRVHRVEGSPRTSDTWERKVIRLCYGRKVGDLAGALYTQELSQGGWVADIGMWRHVFEDQVVKTLHKLAQQGYICLQEYRIAVGDQGTRTSVQDGNAVPWPENLSGISSPIERSEEVR